jgi:hypothetical protein
MAKKVIQPPEPEVTLEAQEPEVKSRLFIATRVAMWHPFQSKRIATVPIELEYDSWVDSQHQAGLIKEVF